MKNLVAVLIVLCLGVPSLAKAEPNFIYIDKAKIEIGMPEAEAITELNESHRTKKIQESGSVTAYLVSHKDGCGIIAE